MELTNKRKVFVAEYLKTWNASEAARRAGYKHPHSQGSRLLGIVEVAKEIQQRLDENKLGADEVLRRLGDIARTDLGPYVRVGIMGNVEVNLEDLKKAGLTHLIKGITPTKHGARIEFHDAAQALQLIGKHHKLFTEMVEVTGEDGGPVTQIIVRETVKEEE